MQPNGALRDRVCRGMMLMLHCRSLIELAPRHLGSRDRFIGRGARARLHNIGLLAYKTRFLILPWVRMQHLASHILGRMARTRSADWPHLYAHPIYFLETFIDPSRFAGACYRAAHWTVMGLATGRGKDAPTRQANRSIKQVLGDSPVKDFCQRLRQWVAVEAVGQAVGLQAGVSVGEVALA